MGVDLIAIGNCCVDIFLPPHTAPPRGGMTVVPSLEAVPGGNGLNTAVAAARLGARTAFSGTLGDDLFGRHLVEILVGEGIDIDQVTLLPGRTTPATVVLNDETGERSFVHHPGTNADCGISPDSLSRKVRLFHFAAPELLPPIWPDRCVDAARSLRARGVTVSADTFVDGPAPDLVADHRAFLGLCDIALPNEEEALLITGQGTIDDAAKYLHDLGVQVVAIKRGAAGASVSTGDVLTHVPTGTVDAVDTCGAGDSFSGGFLAAYLRGLDPVQCARVGCAMGTRCVQFRGSLTGTSDERFLKPLRELL